MKQYISLTDLQLDEYEREILEMDDRGELEEAARNTIERIRKNRNINIRVNESEIDALKSRAQKVGIPYQTLIGALIHQYKPGKIKLEL